MPPPVERRLAKVRRNDDTRICSGIFLLRFFFISFFFPPVFRTAMREIPRLRASNYRNPLRCSFLRGNILRKPV